MAVRVRRALRRIEVRTPYCISNALMRSSVFDSFSLSCQQGMLQHDDDSPFHTATLIFAYLLVCFAFLLHFNFNFNR
jgi:hypothetical protein